jgi:TonB family protein
MKQCPTCHEEFADKFGFCPVDGTPLNGHVAQEIVPAQVAEESSVVTAAAVPPLSSASANGHEQQADEINLNQSPIEREEYHLTILEDAGITSRLMAELREAKRESQLTWPEFKRDPVGFSKRTAVAYGTVTRRFFNQPYVTLAVVTGVLAMMVTVTALVFPYGLVYKWIASDGKLVANVGMPLNEVQQRSTLKLGAPNGQVDSSGATAIAADNVHFDFELAGTGLNFEWSRSYLLQLDENQNISKINVELAQKNETWKQLKGSLLDLAEWLEVKGWRPMQDDDGVSSVAFLKAKMEGPPQATKGSVGEFRWMSEEGLLLTISAARLSDAGPVEDPGNAGQFIYGITVERVPADSLQLVTMIPQEQEKPDEGPAGTNKGTGGGSKPKPEKPGGGGGGGRENPLPVSFGKIAPGSMNPQIIPPSVRPPIEAPKLPVAATLKGDPLLLPEDTRPIPFGDPKSASLIPSDGPGKGGGQGTGKGTGQGPGEGAGYGPGRGENVGGGDPNYGGGGPGGGGGGAPVDYGKTFRPNEVTSKAVIISKPDPPFTEEARKNNVTGVVRLRAILSSGGSVTGISVIKGLPDGLTERAISAARNIRFRPAQKDGRSVSQYITLEYNFNIY